MSPRTRSSPPFLLLIAAPLLARASGAQTPPPLPPPPRVLPGDLAPGLAGGVQREPAIAAGGPGYLVAWQDARARFGALLANTGTEDVYAVRLDASGQPLDPVPFPVTSQEVFGEMREVRVAWNGTHWLVAWEHQSPTTFFYAAEIRGVRVAADGTVVDPVPISILAYPFSGSAEFALASDGDGWLVVAQGSSAGESDIRGVRIAASGTVLDPGGRSLYSIQGLGLHFGLAFVQDRYLFVRANFPGIRAQLISQDMTLIGSEFTVTGGDVNIPSVATDGTAFAVAWQENLVSGAEIRLARVGRNGTVSPPVRVTAGGGGEYARDPALTFDGVDYVVVFEQGLFTIGLDVARISTSGTVLDFGGVPLGQGTQPSTPVIASAGARSVQIAWFELDSDAPPDTGDVLGTHVGPGLLVDPEVPLSISAPRQGFVDLAAGGPGFVAVFRSEREGTVFVLAQRTDSHGRPLDPEPLVVASGDPLGHPAVAWNGSVFLVTWEDRGTPAFGDDVLRARRLAPDGTFVDPAPFDVMPGLAPDVAAVGDLFCVVGSRFTTTQIQEAFAARVEGSTGTVLDPLGIQVGASFASSMEVAALGNVWVATWQSNFSHDDPRSVVDAAVVRPDGSRTSAIQVGGSGGAGGAADPTVAASDAAALIVWVDGTQPSEVDLTGRLLGADGLPLGGAFPVSEAQHAQTVPDAAWDGQEFTVVWEDLRSQAAFFDVRPDVFAARVTEGGSVLDPTGFVVSAGPTFEVRPAVSGARGDTLFGLGLLEPSPPLATQRIALSYQDEWQVLGGASPGAAGPPSLQGEPGIVAGASFDLLVEEARPGAPGLILLGLSQVGVKLFGGVLVPRPDARLGFVTDPAGSARVSVPVPAGLAPGTDVWVQALVLDPTSTGGVALSDALTTTSR